MTLRIFLEKVKRTRSLVKKKEWNTHQRFLWFYGRGERDVSETVMLLVLLHDIAVSGNDSGTMSSL